MSYSFVTPVTVAYQAPLSMGFPRKNIGLGCHFLLQKVFLTQQLSLGLLPWQTDYLPLSHLGSPDHSWEKSKIKEKCALGVHCSKEDATVLEHRELSQLDPLRRES